MTQENASKVAIEKLKEESKTFFQETKKIFKSCTFACVNVDDFGLHGVWGDFKKRKEAIEFLTMIARTFKGGKPEAKVFEGKYRVSISF